jgi:urease accessory protein
MLRAIDIREAGTWNDAVFDEVRIDHGHRHRRRLLLKTEAGREILLDLPRAMRLRQDDGLVLEDGRMVRVNARPEPIMAIRAPDKHLLLRLAWHLGNRHLPVQILPDELRIQSDHVIAEMARGLGAEVTESEAAFDPEPGAYDAGGHHHG